MRFEFKVNSPEETYEIGRKIGEYLEKGDIVTMSGSLGAGKTVMTKGIAAALSVTETVTSPTYTLMNVYESGRIPVYHYDAYRLSSAGDLYDIGFWDNADDAVSVVEWANNVFDGENGNLFGVVFERLDAESPTARRITVDTPDGRSAEL